MSEAISIKKLPLEEFKQAMFNIAYKGLRSQGFCTSKFAYKTDSDPFALEARCAYRGENGMKCAIGYIIPDDKYSPEIEGFTAQDPPVIECLNDFVDEEDYSRISFLMSLQTQHDSANSPEDMEKRYRNFAAEQQLTIPE